jgi:hypothetical protein
METPLFVIRASAMDDDGENESEERLVNKKMTRGDDSK